MGAATVLTRRAIGVGTATCLQPRGASEIKPRSTALAWRPARAAAERSYAAAVRSSECDPKDVSDDCVIAQRVARQHVDDGNNIFMEFLIGQTCKTLPFTRLGKEVRGNRNSLFNFTLDFFRWRGRFHTGF